ncbi:hypothetical protein [Chondromyces apiculatus]|uniref:Uncharacterized protein n=1 Tax=Chondromyces apiculatus DSM 436 TaxID=1192034 RepID=A0A017SZ89_9BACT|nr:hypothetical protein [Chondromyces apiculatus]EYF02047.1 Hypothetical protein CAP_7526 [Chondromyces apiculatus DSM 436]
MTKRAQDELLRLALSDAPRSDAEAAAQSPSSDEGEPLDPPATDEEILQARALAEALEHGDDLLATALLSALAPPDLGAVDHDALIARALSSPALSSPALSGPALSSPALSSPALSGPALSGPALSSDEAQPTPAEQHASEALRAWLDDPAAPPDASVASAAELAGILRAANHPASLPELPMLRNEALIVRALGRKRAATPRRLVPVTMAALSGLAAAAAAVALFLNPAADSPTASHILSGSGAQAALIPSRSTSELFDPATPFPREGGESARIDRIATARAADLRANRYAAWGVQ